MATKLRRGFPSEAEQIAEEIRDELGVGNIKALDPHALICNLKIPVISLGQLFRSTSDHSVHTAVEVLRTTEARSLSAITVFAGGARKIVYNDSHALERQASDLSHEVAHALLLHKPAPAFDETGCRAWNSEIETEADYLGGCLLIPGKGARYAAKSGWSLAATANHFGCSIDMARWRDNKSGGRRLRN